MVQANHNRFFDIKMASGYPDDPEGPGDDGGGDGGGDGGADDGGDYGGAVITESRVRVSRPSLYKVVLHNDDYTPMEFVIEILVNIFKKSRADATTIMLNVHKQGIGVCGVYPFGVAETKVAQVMEAAKSAEYPLQCSLEKA